ncbi:MAG: hypothetical protein JW731_10805 [Bacteroidales bacterium]|nr:hypothetical protein [Bacteroidales bacterium]
MESRWKGTLLFYTVKSNGSRHPTGGQDFDHQERNNFPNLGDEHVLRVHYCLGSHRFLSARDDPQVLEAQISFPPDNGIMTIPGISKNTRKDLRNKKIAWNEIKIK